MPVKVMFRIDVFDGVSRRHYAMDCEQDAVPRAGEWVELAPGWAAETVDAVAWLPLERAVVVQFKHADTSEEDAPQEYGAALLAAGWTTG